MDLEGALSIYSKSKVGRAFLSGCRIKKEYIRIKAITFGQPSYSNLGAFTYTFSVIRLRFPP